MDPIDSRESGRIGWHLIARGGDMTARVHPGMRLGVLPSGDISFEAPDSVIELGLTGETLTLSAVAEDYELEMAAGERTRAIRVSPLTHVCIDFLGHTLDMDNDFAVASPPGNALMLFVVRRGEPRRALGPRKAPPRITAGQTGERLVEPTLLDSLKPEPSAARAGRRAAAERRDIALKLLGALAASLLVVAGLAAVALWAANQMPAPPVEAGPAATTEPAAPVDPVAGPATVAEPLPVSAELPDTAVSGAGKDEAGVGADVLDRLSDLLEAGPLPDKVTIDFAVESLRSLMVAYPEDVRIPAALTRLNERLVVEARVSYDNGDAFRAGRLIEQAARLGMADASVAETLGYFEQQSPGRALAVAIDGSPDAPSLTAGREVPPAYPEAELGQDSLEPVERKDQKPAEQAGELSVETPVEMPGEEPIEQQAEPPVRRNPTRETDPAIDEIAGEGEAEPIDLVDQAPVVEASAAMPAGDGLDRLVESATGLALGALAVEVVVEDAPGPAAEEPVVPGPFLSAAPETGIESRVQAAFDSLLREASVDPVVSANDLPDGFALEASATAAPSAVSVGASRVSAGPAFRPYSELIPRRQMPLVYPRRAVPGAEGSVEVAFTVTESGDVVDVSVRGDAPSVFLREAVRTIRQWRFEPVVDNGERVPVRTALRITYRG